MTRERTILHVDMDAFYASVEVLRDPSLAGRPVIVGGSGARGVVASCSYEARAFGVHSAMPSVRARRLCPDAVFLHGAYDVYADTSRRLHQVLLSFTPLVEGIALDEAFLDVTGARRLFGSGAEVASAVRGAVAEELRLSCSVGVGGTKLVAKLASKAAKPRAALTGTVPGPGVVVVAPGEEVAFLHPLPVDALWGVGPATEQRLRRLGVVTIGDLAAVPVETVVACLGGAAGRQLHDLSWGRDASPVEPDRQTKSIGHEETYARDHHEQEPLRREVVRMADAVAGRLRAARLAGRTVTLKVRFHDFSTITRAHSLATPVDTAPDIARVAVALLGEVDVSSGVRLVGVSVSNLAQGGARQLSLDDTGTGRGWDAASRAVDDVRDRFGDGAVGPATLAGNRGLEVKRRGDTQWGPGGRGDR
jgi:DNA polymerase-4